MIFCDILQIQLQISYKFRYVMAKVNLTAGRIAAFKCPDDKAQAFLWCNEVQGLAVRATVGSTRKRYIFESKVNGKTMRSTIGEVSVWSIADAQAEARRLQTIIDQGKDPRKVKADIAAAEEAALLAKKEAEAALVLKNKIESLTFGKVWAEYIAERKDAKEGKDNSWSDRHYHDHVKMIHAGGEKRKRSEKLTEAAPLASLAELRLVDITSDKVSEWANTEAQKRPTQARLAFRLLRAFLSWCNKHKVYGKIVKDNAAKNEVARKRLGKPKTKNDVLQREQLEAWFAAVKQLNNSIVSVYLQTLLLTGSRREELAKLKWTDVDFQWKKITLDDKVQDDRPIPLTPYVAHLLQSLPRKSEYVFSSPTAKSGRLTDPSDAHRRACAVAGIELTLHGLRRSFATLSEWTETPAGIAAQIQGHAPQGVRENNYIRRPLDLLRMWHNRIEAWMLEQAKIKFEPVQN